MIALVLAGLILGSAAVVVARSRRRPEPQPVRIEPKDGKSRRRR